MHVCALEEIEETRVVGCGCGERGVGSLCGGEVGGERVMGVPEFGFGGVQRRGRRGEGGEFGCQGGLGAF